MIGDKQLDEFGVCFYLIDSHSICCFIFTQKCEIIQTKMYIFFIHHVSSEDHMGVVLKMEISMSTE